MEQILELHRGNRRQWDREDDVRRAYDDDSAVAAAKRDIDGMNSARHGHIEAIDRTISSLIPSCHEAPLVTESPGTAIDRLSVLVIRIGSTEARAASDTTDSTFFADRLPRLRNQLDLLEGAVDSLLGDLAGGRRRFIRHESLKLYGAGGPVPAD